MGRWLLLSAVVLGAAVLVFGGDESDGQAARPNILLIVLDDFGYNDLGANGNDMAPTPNLDEFAAQGTRYTRHYADASCAVARVTLLTGRNPAGFGFRPVALGLSSDTRTIASFLRDNGYRTFHVGKWHVGNATLEQSPGRLGFQDWFGFLFQSELAGGPNKAGTYKRPTYFNPWLRENNAPPEKHLGHLTDILTDRAVDFIDTRAHDEQPWFLNLWFYAPHNPLQAAPRFRERYPEGVEGDYYALLEQLDFSVGRVLATLDDNELTRDTLVIVVSDNGGTNIAAENNYPFEGYKGTYTEGGLRTPLLIRWPGHTKAGRVDDTVTSLYDIFPSLATAAGAEIPAGLQGRNLFGDEADPTGNLYWESSDSLVHMYSVLSPDGRWRLTVPWYAPPLLYDLRKNPRGDKDVISDHPRVASRLNNEYLEWRRTVRNVGVSDEPLNDRGQRILRGDDQQRSPGYSGFSFAIGATPGEGADGTRGYIADHPGRWSLVYDAKEGLQLDVLGTKMKGPVLRAGECSDIVVATHFRMSPRTPERNNAIIMLFVDGVLAAGQSMPQPPLNTWGKANPTYIGISASGSSPFQGELSAPVIINERLVLDAQADKIGNGLSSIASNCPAPAEDRPPPKLIAVAEAR